MTLPKISLIQSLWICLSAFVLSAALAMATPSPAKAVVIVENNFNGSGTLKLAMGGIYNQYVKCTSAVVKGTVPYPPNGKATITEWSPGNCTVYRQANNTTIATATVQILKIPVVEAVSTTTLYLGEFTAKATYERNGSTCTPEFTVSAYNPFYTNGSTNNTAEAFPYTSYFNWSPFPPEECASGGGYSEITFSFPNPQFEVTERSELPSMYELRNSNSGDSPDSKFNLDLQQASDIPISGDWDNNGTDTVGFFRPSTATFYLSNTNSNINAIFQFGATGDRPVAGDWNGDGTDTIGVYRPNGGVFYLRDSNSAGAANYQFQFGNTSPSEDLPVAGDWDNDKNNTDTIGVYRPSNGVFYLRNSNSSGSPDYSFAYGNTGNDDLPIAGDWDGDGFASVGVFRQSVGTWFQDNQLPGDQPISYVHTFGPFGHTVPIVGDWNKDGTDTPGAVWK